MELKTLNEQETALCGKFITERKLLEALMGMANEKSPGNDGLSAEFYKKNWNNIKEPFMASLIEAKIKGALSTSQRQEIIRLIKKKTGTKQK